MLKINVHFQIQNISLHFKFKILGYGERLNFIVDFMLTFNAIFKFKV
jgi:hypothetical protein